MKIGILSRGEQNHSTQRLTEAARAAGHAATVLDPFGFYLQIGGTGPRLTYHGTPAAGFDVVITRLSRTTVDYGIEVVAHLEWIGIPLLNRAEPITAARHKFRSLRILAQHGVPVPQSLTVGNTTFLAEAVSELGEYPFVLKPFHGTHGRGILLLDTQTSLVSAVGTLCDLHQDYLIQPFSAEAEGVDRRALVLGGEVVAAMQRQAPPGEFRANIHKGGIASAVTLSDTETEIARAAAAALELEIAGVDLIQTHHGPVVLEVNPSPGFEALETATGEDIAGAIVRYATTFARNR